MITYFVIGIIVQLVILIERYIRLPEVRNLKWCYGYWFFWLCLLLGSLINAVIWPISIVCEIILIVLETKGTGDL